MNKQQKIETYFETNPKTIMTSFDVYKAKFKNDPDTSRQTVSALVHGIAKKRGCIEIVSSHNNQNYYRYKEAATPEKKQFDDSNHEENRVRMVRGSWFKTQIGV